LCAQAPTENSQAKLDSLDKLIAVEWDMINELKELLREARYTRDKIRISNSLAYHVNCLNRLLIQKGETPLNEETLGTLITRLPKKAQRRVLREFRIWKRKLSSAS